MWNPFPTHPPHTHTTAITVSYAQYLKWKKEGGGRDDKIEQIIPAGMLCPTQGDRGKQWTPDRKPTCCLLWSEDAQPPAPVNSELYLWRFLQTWQHGQRSDMCRKVCALSVADLPHKTSGGKGKCMALSVTSGLVFQHYFPMGTFNPLQQWLQLRVLQEIRISFPFICASSCLPLLIRVLLQCIESLRRITILRIGRECCRFS